jgi:hypothetical protein
MSLLFHKSKLIQTTGSTVRVLKFATQVATDTKAVTGRSTRTNTNMIALESQKEGIFLPEISIDSGDFVIEAISNETFVVSGTMPEIVRDQKIATIAILLKCNNLLTVGDLVLAGDLRGNLSNQFNATHSDVPCYVRQVDNKLRQYDSGLHPDTEYEIFTTHLMLKETDKAFIMVNGVGEEYKVISKDYITFPNMLVMQACRDIRA